MISARKAALQGLAVPLTAIMVAILGLWPEEDEDEELPPLPPTNAGGGGGRIAPARPAAQRFRRQLAQIRRQNMIAVATVLAMVQEGILT